MQLLTFPGFGRTSKSGFTRRTSPPGSASAWQSRDWERTVRDEAELQACVDYVHINPIKHGLVKALADWPHSTFHRYVRNGWLPLDWSVSCDRTGQFGER